MVHNNIIRYHVPVRVDSTGLFATSVLLLLVAVVLPSSYYKASYSSTVVVA